MLITRPINNESCLLTGHEDKPLSLYDLEGNKVVSKNPPGGSWTHDSIEQAAESLVSTDARLKYGWDAYLGDKSQDNWIGSSEL